MTRKELKTYMIIGRVAPVFSGLGILLFFAMGTNLYSIVMLIVGICLFVINQVQYERKFQDLLKTLP